MHKEHNLVILPEGKSPNKRDHSKLLTLKKIKIIKLIKSPGEAFIHLFENVSFHSFKCCQLGHCMQNQIVFS